MAGVVAKAEADTITIKAADTIITEEAVTTMAAADITIIMATLEIIGVIEE